MVLRVSSGLPSIQCVFGMLNGAFPFAIDGRVFRENLGLVFLDYPARVGRQQGYWKRVLLYSNNSSISANLRSSSQVIAVW